MRWALLALAVLCGCEDGAAPSAPQAMATPAPEPGAPAAASPYADTEPGFIPAAFHGVWDSEGGSCNLGSAQRIEVGPRRIVFADGVGNAAGVGIEGSDVIADLVMEDAGPMSLRIVRLQLTSVGERKALLLLPGEDGEDTGIMLRPVPHFRCAG